MIDASKDEAYFGWSLECLDFPYSEEICIKFGIELARAKFMLRMKLD
jgi:hypothetical protein